MSLNNYTEMDLYGCYEAKLLNSQYFAPWGGKAA